MNTNNNGSNKGAIGIPIDAFLSNESKNQLTNDMKTAVSKGVYQGLDSMDIEHQNLFGESERLRQQIIKSHNIDSNIVEDHRFSNYKDLLEYLVSSIDYDKSHGIKKSGFGYIMDFPSIVGAVNKSGVPIRVDSIERISRVLDNYYSGAEKNIFKNLISEFGVTNDVLNITDKITGGWIPNQYQSAIRDKTSNPYPSNIELRKVNNNKHHDLPFFVDYKSPRYFSTSLDSIPDNELTLYEARVKNTIQAIGTWSTNVLDIGMSPSHENHLNIRKDQFVNELFAEFFNGFNFTGAERDEVKNHILLEINKLLDFNGMYEIEDGKSNLLTFLNEIGGFGKYTESQAREIFRNKATLELAKNKGLKNINEVSIFDLAKGYKRVPFGGNENFVVDVPDFRSSPLFEDNISSIKFNNDGAWKISGNPVQQLEELIKIRNKILNTVFNNNIYGGHPIATQSSNGKYEILPGAKDVFNNRLSELGFGFVEMRIAELSKNFADQNNFRNHFNKHTSWIDDGRGHFYERSKLEENFNKYGNDGKYNVAPSYARRLFHNEVLRYYNSSEFQKEIQELNLKDYESMLPNIGMHDWQKKGNIFHKDLKSLQSYSSNKFKDKYKKLFDNSGMKLEELQSVFTALSYFTDGEFGNFLAGIHDYNIKHVKGDKTLKTSDEDIKRRLFPYLNFFDKDSTAQARILEHVYKAKAPESERETYKLIKEIISLLKQDKQFGHAKLTDLNNGQLKNVSVLPIVGEGLYTSYSARMNYANSKTTSNMHTWGVRQTVYQNKDHLVNGIADWFLGNPQSDKDTSIQDLYAFVNGILALETAKYEQHDFSTRLAGSNKDIITASDSLISQIATSGENRENEMILYVKNLVKKGMEIKSEIDNIDAEINKLQTPVTAHNTASENLIRGLIFKNKKLHLNLSNEDKKFLLDNNITEDKFMNLDSSDNYESAYQRMLANKKQLLSNADYNFRIEEIRKRKEVKESLQSEYDSIFGYQNDGNGLRFAENLNKSIVDYIVQNFAGWENAIKYIFNTINSNDGDKLKEIQKARVALQEQVDKEVADKLNIIKDAYKNSGTSVTFGNSSAAQLKGSAPDKDKPIGFVGSKDYVNANEKATIALNLANQLLGEINRRNKDSLLISDETKKNLDILESDLKDARESIINSKRSDNKSGATAKSLKESANITKNLVNTLRSTWAHAQIENDAYLATSLEGMGLEAIVGDERKKYEDAAAPFINKINKALAESSDKRDYAYIQQLTAELVNAINSVPGKEINDTSYFGRQSIIQKAQGAAFTAKSFVDADGKLNFHSGNEEIAAMISTVNSLVSEARDSGSDDSYKQLKELTSLLVEKIKREIDIRRNESPEYQGRQNSKAASIIYDFYTTLEKDTYKSFADGGIYAKTNVAERIDEQKFEIKDTIAKINKLINKDTPRTKDENDELEGLIKLLSAQNGEFKKYIDLQLAKLDPLYRSKQILQKGFINEKGNAALTKYDVINQRFANAGYLSDDSTVYSEDEKMAVRDIQSRAAMVRAELAAKIKSNTNGSLNIEIDALTKELAGMLDNLQQFLTLGKEDKKSDFQDLRDKISAYLEKNTNIYKNPELAGQFLELQNKIIAMNGTVKDSEQAFKNLDRAAERAGLKNISIYQQFGKLVKQHLSTFFVMRGIHAVRRAITQTYNNIVQIDTAMTELKKVTDSTDTAYNDFFDSAISKAKQFGVAITEVISATSEFAKLGYSLKDASIMADAAIVYKNVGDGIKDVQSASQSIISTIKAFEMPVSDTMEVVDVLNEIGNKFSITSGGVGEALEKSASSLSQAGNSLAESVALIATANTTLQNPSVVGNALKTISLRLTKTKTELEAMGEDTDFHVGVSSAYRNEILGLTNNKVDIMEDDGATYKSTYKILEELSEVWDELSGKTQSALLYDLGGARQANTLAAILNNFDIAQDALKAAEEASGSALRENEKYLESIAGQMSILKSTMQEYSTQLLDDNVVKGILKITNAFASLATSLTSVSSAWAPLVGLLAFSRQSKGTFDVNQLFKTLMPHDGWKDDNLSAIGQVFSVGQTRINNINSYTQAADLFRQFGSIGVTNGTKSKNKWSSVNGIFEKMDDLANADGTPTIIGQQVASIKELVANGDIDTAKKQAQDLSKTFDNMGKNMLTFGDALSASLKAVAATMIITAAIKGISWFVDTIAKTTDEAQEALEETRNKIISVKDEINELHDLEKANNGLTSEEKARLNYLEKYQERLEAIEKIELRNLYSKKYNAEGNWWQSLVNTFTGESSASQKAVEWLDYAVGDDSTYENIMDHRITKYADTELIYNEASDDDTRATIAQDMQQQQSVLIRDAEDLAAHIDAVEAEKAEIEAFLNSGNLADTDKTDAQQELEERKGLLDRLYAQAKQYKELGIEDIDLVLPDADELYNFANAYSFTVDAIKKANTIGTASEQIDGMQQAFEALAEATADYNKDGAYSLDTLQSLATMDSRYLKYLNQTGDQLKVVAGATEDLSNAMILQMRISIAKNTLGEMERIAALSSIEAAEEQAAAEQTLTQVLTAELNVLQQQIQALMAKEYALNGDSAKYKLMNQAVKSHNLLMLETNNILGKQNELQEDRQQKLEDRLKLEGDVFNDVIDKRIEALQDEIDKINELYEAEDRELELQKRKNAYMAAQANKTVRLYTHDKGWQWVADPTKVKEAKDEYEEYLREVEKDKAIEALEDQIEKYEDLKEAVNEAMDHIGESLEEHNLELRLTAQFEAMAFDSMRIAADDYKNRVIGSLQSVNAELNETLRLMNQVGVDPIGEIEVPDAIDRSIYDGESAYWDEFGNQTPTWSLDKYTKMLYENKKKSSGVLKLHSGGPITAMSGAKVSDQFILYMNKLQSDEVPAILQAGEYVLTRDMQKNILNNNQVMHDALMRHNSTSNSIAIGDVVINNPVGDVNSLSKAIVNQLPNRVLRDIYKS